MEVETNCTNHKTMKSEKRFLLFYKNTTQLSQWVSTRYSTNFLFLFFFNYNIYQSATQQQQLHAKIRFEYQYRISRCMFLDSFPHTQGGMDTETWWDQFPGKGGMTYCAVWTGEISLSVLPVPQLCFFHTQINCYLQNGVSSYFQLVFATILISSTVGFFHIKFFPCQFIWNIIE